MLAGLVTMYCIDAMTASMSILNLVLVLPVSAAVLLLCAIQFFTSVPKIRQDVVDVEPAMDIVPVVSLFTIYVTSLPLLGFDIGTLLFNGIFLWFHGERRWRWLIGYSLSIAFTLSLFFSKMLPYPMPMLLLDSAY